MQSFNSYEWVSKTEEYHLRKNDLLNLKEGEKIDILLLNLNTYEIAITDKNINTDYLPTIFFKDNKVTFTKQNGLLEGMIFFQNFKTLGKKITLQVEYKRNHWCSLVNEKIPENIKCNCPEDKNLEIIDLEKDNYKIGINGPIIKWEDLKKLPNIYVTEEQMNM